jgi:hypothetical protein
MNGGTQSEKERFMSMLRPVVLLNLCLTLVLGARAGEDTDSLIELKLALPKGDTYLRGNDADPVNDLVADITLINKTAKEDLVKKTIQVPEVGRLTAEELVKLRDMTPEQQKALLKTKEGTRDVEVLPINEKSLGYAYVEPRLGQSSNIEFIITKLPEEGETVAEGARPVIIARDNAPDQAMRLDAEPNKYLPAGETSPAYSLQVGKYYLIRAAGMYSIKAAMPGIPDPKSPTGYVISNEEKFRVLPFKKVERKIEDLQRELNVFERGYPDFDYMLYQVQAEANFDEVYALQRVALRGADRWEWTRLCSVKAGTQAQVAQLAPKKVALLAVHVKGDAGLYTIDFSTPGVKIDSKIVPVKEGTQPKLKNEGGNLSVE